MTPMIMADPEDYCLGLRFSPPSQNIPGNTTSLHENATRRNGSRLMHTKISVWASHWLVFVLTIQDFRPFVLKKKEGALKGRLKVCVQTFNPLIESWHKKFQLSLKVFLQSSHKKFQLSLKV